MPSDVDHGALFVVSGVLEGQRFELDVEECLVGRSPKNQVVLPDGGVSREHAVILFDGETSIYTIEDLQSTNGTRVNGKLVRSAELSEGDEIQLGRTILRFDAKIEAPSEPNA